jgi:hypothetical protein
MGASLLGSEDNSMASTAERDDPISRIGHEIYENQLRLTVETEANIGNRSQHLYG